MLPNANAHRAKLKDLRAAVQSKKQQLVTKAASRRSNLDSVKKRFAGAVQAAKKQQ
ncbi:hypothetical protein [Sediminibacillus halophilus]|uniref:Uncharacterized protein n=1 Tax=Sediminibacillus halophilus TaxID=482461 RepID=A0A1G9NRT0_9BACI|nr:hypothetical protein [Sediminibacillus halophilus]SDL89292.1 hypothetical protein SAMN05216244_1133 [Sediminibacillus halophilus]